MKTYLLFLDELSKIENAESEPKWNPTSSEALDRVLLFLQDAERTDKSAAERRHKCVCGVWWLFKAWKAIAEEESK